MVALGSTLKNLARADVRPSPLIGPWRLCKPLRALRHVPIRKQLRAIRHMRRSASRRASSATCSAVRCGLNLRKTGSLVGICCRTVSTGPPESPPVRSCTGSDRATHVLVECAGIRSKNLPLAVARTHSCASERRRRVAYGTPLASWKRVPAALERRASQLLRCPALDNISE